MFIIERMRGKVRVMKDKRYWSPMLVLAAVLLVMSGAVYAENTASIDLNGSSNYLSAPDTASISFTGDFTAEMWVKFDSDSGNPCLICKYETSGNQKSWFIQKDSSGDSIHMTATSDGFTETSGSNVSWNPTLGQWYHVAAVYDASAGSAEFFVNGSSIGSSTGLPTSIYDGTATLNIGRYGDACCIANYLDGRIDEIRLWNVDRTAQQIADDYQLELTGSEANLVAYWPLNNSLEDATAQNNDLNNGTGATFSADIPPTLPAAPLGVRKGATQTVSSDTTTDNDSDLIISLEPDREYVIEGVIFASSTSATPDVKLAFSAPNGSTLDIAVIDAEAAKSELIQSPDTDSASIPLTATHPIAIQVSGTVKTGGAAGNFAVQWAQNQTNATAVGVLRGSYLRANEI
jgi:hypothetical protein